MVISSVRTATVAASGPGTKPPARSRHPRPHLLRELLTSTARAQLTDPELDVSRLWSRDDRARARAAHRGRQAGRRRDLRVAARRADGVRTGVAPPGAGVAGELIRIVDRRRVPARRDRARARPGSRHRRAG